MAMEFGLGDHVSPGQTSAEGSPKTIGQVVTSGLLGGPPLPPLHKKHHRDEHKVKMDMKV